MNALPRLLDKAAYTAAIEALFARRPEFMIPGLRRIEALSASLGNPQRSYPAIQITGTNGKTSMARMITALLVARGLHVGTYTSPHLQDVRERFRLDGSPVQAADILAGLIDLQPHLDHVERVSGEMVTFFEASTALAQWLFAKSGIDVGVFEVGMGGRWDATNLVDGRVALVGRVELDHPQLGSTVEEVAWEKAGIIKPGAQVIVAGQADGPARVIQRETRERGARLRRAGQDFAVERRTITPTGQSLTLRGLDGRRYPIDLPLHGAHQALNAACALAAVQAFTNHELDPDLVRAGFAKVRSPGRLEVFQPANQAPVVLDGAHNPDAAACLASALQELFSGRRQVFVLGILEDKDIDAMVERFLAVANELIVTTPDCPRAAPPDRLAAAAARHGRPARQSPSVPEALDLAADLARGDGIVITTGSLFTVGEARAVLGGTLV